MPKEPFKLLAWLEHLFPASLMYEYPFADSFSMNSLGYLYNISD
jgi:hypothetical protein